MRERVCHVAFSWSQSRERCPQDVDLVLKTWTWCYRLMRTDHDMQVGGCLTVVWSTRAVSDCEGGADDAQTHFDRQLAGEAATVANLVQYEYTCTLNRTR